MNNDQFFMSSLPLSGARARRMAIPGAVALALAGVGAWLTRNDPLPVRMSSGAFLGIISVVGLVLLGVSAWMHLRRAVWVLRADASEISLTIEDIRGRAMKRQHVAVRELREIRWVEGDADISPGFLLRTGRGNEFTIPAEVLDTSTFTRFAMKLYPGVLLIGCG